MILQLDDISFKIFRKTVPKFFKVFLCILARNYDHGFAFSLG